MNEAAFPIADSWLRPGVLLLTLNRPEECNLIDDAFIEYFLRLLHNYQTDTSLRLVLLKSTGRVFSGGARLQWLQEVTPDFLENNFNQARRLFTLFAELNNFPVPVVCVVQGPVYGGGIALVAASDIAIALEGSTFQFSETHLGLLPACAAPFVSAKMGASWARRYMLSGEQFSALQARSVGLIHDVVANLEEIDDRISILIDNILRGSPHAVRATKKLLLDLNGHVHIRDQLEIRELATKLLTEARLSLEAQERLATYLAKRSK